MVEGMHVTGGSTGGAVRLACWGGQKAPFILLFTSASLSSMKMALLGSLLDIFSCPCNAMQGGCYGGSLHDDKLPCPCNTQQAVG